MKDGFIKTACAAVDIKVGDVNFNTDNIIKTAKEAEQNGAKLIVFPELSITAYTCGDLFFQKPLIDGAKNALMRLVYETAELDIIIVVGLPIAFEDKLYNCAAIVNKGLVKGIVPKKNIPNYCEFYEARHFSEGFDELK